MSPESILTHYLAACFGAVIGFFLASLFRVGSEADDGEPIRKGDFSDEH